MLLCQQLELPTGAPRPIRVAIVAPTPWAPSDMLATKVFLSFGGLTFDTASVPEPSLLAFLGLGVMGLVLVAVER